MFYKNKKIIIGLSLLVISLAIFVFQETKITKFFFENNEIHSVLLTNEGFKPQTLQVRKGDTVVFTTDRPFPFWPASDKHPSHSTYPDFDPRYPVPSDTAWEFTFVEVGDWSYHDHLNSTLRGSIQVTE